MEIYESIEWICTTKPKWTTKFKRGGTNISKKIMKLKEIATRKCNGSCKTNAWKLLRSRTPTTSTENIYHILSQYKLRKTQYEYFCGLMFHGNATSLPVLGFAWNHENKQLTFQERNSLNAHYNSLAIKSHIVL